MINRIKRLLNKKGKWVIKYHGFPPEPTTVCSECGFDRDFNVRTRGFGKIKYCPNCGRRMTNS
jgi:transposase